MKNNGVFTSTLRQTMAASASNPTETNHGPYREHLLRYLQAARDFPKMDVGPEPECPDQNVRAEVMRDFKRIW